MNLSLRDKSIEVASDLKRIVKGEVRFDEISRALYSTAACIFKIMPMGIVIPNDEEDVIKVVNYAHAHKIPITARGSGSSLAGQALGEGIIIDFSKYMNKILEINEKESYVRVQPGVVLADLNKALSRINKFFPPDPSSGNWCTIGGMIANNSGGARSAKYGDTRAYTISLKIVLANGEVITTKPIKLYSDEWKKIIESKTLESEVYRRLREIYEENQNLIEESYPKVSRNSSGYYLKDMIKDEKIDITKLFVGSEGTLGVIIEAKLKIMERPKVKATALAYFSSLEDAGEAIIDILNFKPSAGELMDERLVSMIRQAYPDINKWLPEGTNAVILIEFDGDDIEKIKDEIEKIRNHLVDDLKIAIRIDVAYDPFEQERLWQIRKSAVPIMNRMKGEKKQIPLVEDASVHPFKIPDYINGIYEIFKKHEVEAIVYGHANDGNIHVRLAMNLKDKKDFDKMQPIADEVYDLILRLGGTFSGEHGDGRLRSAYIPKLFKQIYPLFKEVKNIFDPLNILNPDVKISDDKNNLIKNLRYNPSYRVVKTGTSLDNHEYINEIEACHGCAQCKSIILTNMCPVYKALHDEKVAPRSKANLLQSLISGQINADYINSKNFFEVLDYCLVCKMCHIECPTNVNIPKIVLQARADCVKKIGQPFSDYIMMNVPFILRLGSITRFITNRSMNIRFFRSIIQKTLGLDKRIKIPRFHRDEMKNWSREPQRYNGKVAYFAGCFARWVEPEIGRATVNVLAKNGVKVMVPDQDCCGIPMLGHGRLDLARKKMEFNLKKLIEFVMDGYDIVSSCPSCSLSLKKDYVDFLNNKDAKLVSEHTYDIGEYLMMLYNEGKLNMKFKEFYLPNLITYHAPCHLKAQEIGKPTWELLKKILKLNFKEIEDDTCCGMAGTYGLTNKNFDLSIKIGSNLFDQLSKINAEFVLTECPTCKMQIEQFVNAKVIHPIQILDRAYGGNVRWY
ncbi:MAG: anaerobic glycerol-3-phosphate dehydrogenase subunit C [archaeon]|nr:anaerobic glycerol-3-phosphate dehydrogenase subunit C [archaeon]